MYNYSRAYDYYKEIGWSGADGLDTPIMVLNDYCSIDHEPIDNACYVGGYLGWQIFLASYANDFSQCLDVLAHEFTHCVTASVMTYNAYKNDFGAINEAMSDIQGKTCEMYYDDFVDWNVGDHSQAAIRRIDDPHAGSQPEYTWDLYYTPNVNTPTTLNDRGGVHTNSSLLNYVAYLVYENGGMTAEEGRAFWFAVDCTMVPGTDYPQLAEILPWVLKVSGLEQYEGALEDAISATRLGQSEVPETLDEDRALVTLSLPDQEPYTDGQWVMMLLDVNVENLTGSVGSLLDSLTSGDFDRFAKLLEGDFEGWIKENLSDVYYTATTNGGQDGTTMRMVAKPGHCVPVLLHGIFNDSTNKLENSYMMCYIAGVWMDAGAMDSEDGSTEAITAAMENIANGMDLDTILDSVFVRIDGGKATELPSGNLKDITPRESDWGSPENEETEAAEYSEPKMSRPKQGGAAAETADAA